MRVALIIPTYGRKSLLARLLAHLETQSRPPDEVIISAPDPAHVDVSAPSQLKIRWLFGRHGLCAQRNFALEYALPNFDIVSFIDDDFLPASNYIATLVDSFVKHPDWAVVMGQVVRDGASTAGYSFEEGEEELRRAEAAAPAVEIVEERPGAYGCNMSVRAQCVGTIRFDERLVLYGWQEDIDFTSQVRGAGRRLVATNKLFGVHLGVKKGKVSGLRFGYSQVVNPSYLARKGTMGVRFGLRLIVRNVAANALRSLFPEPYVDRRGRLRGNLLGLFHLATGRLEPEHILKL